MAHPPSRAALPPHRDRGQAERRVTPRGARFSRASSSSGQLRRPQPPPPPAAAAWRAPSPPPPSSIAGPASHSTRLAPAAGGLQQHDTRHSGPRHGHDRRVAVARHQPLAQQQPQVARRARRRISSMISLRQTGQRSRCDNLPRPRLQRRVGQHLVRLDGQSGAGQQQKRRTSRLIPPATAATGAARPPPRRGSAGPTGSASPPSAIIIAPPQIQLAKGLT